MAGARVRFRHPLVRSAVYRSAALPERRAAHLALAEVTDRDLDPDRRTWHLAAAAAGPDEQVAAELERSAGRAQTRGGVAAAAAFLQRAVVLTAEPGPRAGRALAAAQANLQAGAFGAALELVAIAEAGPLDDLQRAQVGLLLVQLLVYVNSLGLYTTWRGDFAAAASLIAEGDAIAEATGTGFAPHPEVFLAGLRGSEADATRLIEVVATDARAARQGLGVQWCQWVSAILYNGLGRYDKALAEARQASEQAPEMNVSAWALPELIEAASRTGQTEVAAEALDRLAAATSAAWTDWAQGIHARSRALLSEGETAESCYREAIERLGRTILRPELARAHLLYGEWLRREGRRADARVQLRTAHDMFAAIGMEAFARRARRELAATGETAGQRTTEARDQLTPQEAQIARLARDGLSNPEIAAQLFLSVKTVEWHLRKVFTKLEISSRLQLQRALPDDASAVRLA